MPPTAESVRLPPDPHEPLPGEYVPVQLVHPELRQRRMVSTRDCRKSPSRTDDDRASCGPTPALNVRRAGEPGRRAAPVRRLPTTPRRAARTRRRTLQPPRAPARAVTNSSSRWLVAVIGCLVVVVAAAGIALVFSRGGSHRSPVRRRRRTLNAMSSRRRRGGCCRVRRRPAAGGCDGVAGCVVDLWWVDEWGGDEQGRGLRPDDLDVGVGPEPSFAAASRDGGRVSRGDGRDGRLGAGGSTLDALVSNRVFVLRNGAWVELPPMLHARAAGAAAVVGDKIVVAGGQANHQLVAPTEVFDGTKWTDVAAIPTPRDHLAAVADGRYFYAVGGRALSADKNLGAVERL